MANELNELNEQNEEARPSSLAPKKSHPLYSSLTIDYQVAIHQEQVGETELTLETLANLDQTIDHLYEVLEKAGIPQALDELCPYFGIVWPAAKALGQFLLEHYSESFRPSEARPEVRVIELGCGLALPSLCLAKQGAQILATDFHPEVPRFLKRNIELNLIPEDRIQYLSINWEKPSPTLGQFDWIIGSDILYESRYARTLAYAINHLMAPQGKVVITDPGRTYLQDFVDVMKKLGLQCKDRIIRIDQPDSKTQDIFLLEFEKEQEL